VHSLFVMNGAKRLHRFRQPALGRETRGITAVFPLTLESLRAAPTNSAGAEPLEMPTGEQFHALRA
jgi:hypothetical protein